VERVDGMTNLVLSELRDHIGILTLNNPEQRNALSVDMRLAIAQVLRDFFQDGECRAIVICGAGGNFCAGGDMKSSISNVVEPATIRTPRLLSMLHDIIRLIAEGSKPVIAAVDGHATGAGLSLAAACDYIVAGPSAKFCASYGRVGLVPDAGLLWSLPRRIGTTRARNLMLTAAALDRDLALLIGLADMAAQEGETVSTAIEIAHNYLRVAPLAAAHIKELLSGDALSLDQAFEAELRIQPQLTGSVDYMEARAAFAEKRPPRFIGQ
jgi:2-(1,2-epoxy-1,2-dihydrophenyl)acetyl-CoA isomerase